MVICDVNKETKNNIPKKTTELGQEVYPKPIEMEPDTLICLPKKTKAK
jgi:hypothetical protein